jgi:hypothetical protein
MTATRKSVAARVIGWGRPRDPMPSAIAFIKHRALAATRAAPRGYAASVVCLAAVHLAAVAIMAWSEADIVSKAAFILTWGLFNFTALAVLRRPVLAAAIGLTLIVVLILLSRFKHDILLMTVNFVDVMVIDADTFAFLLAIFPDLAWAATIGAVIAVPLVIVLWRADPFRVGWRAAIAGAAACLGGLTALALLVPTDRQAEFYNENYVSKFARSGVTAIADLWTRGLMESDAASSERLRPAADYSCRLAHKPPHIVMVFDESSFDITAIPGVKVPPDYRRHFRSFDGKERAFVVEGAGGPSWYTEYNVMAGLSVRSYGRFADFITRVASGRVERGLPHALRHCGYRTFSLYPFLGAFLGARSFQTTTGIDRFLDARDMGTRAIEPDSFYFDYAARLIARERRDQPLFLLVYTAANHFPWTYRFRPELTPLWRDPGNGAEVDEYVRRQSMSARDYAAFIERLGREFPGEPFLVVRFGDHQPFFAKHIIDPALDEAAIARHIAQSDPRFFTTYYAVEAINFRPVDLSSALDTLDAPYLPLVVLEAAGLPLDPSFAEQKKMLQRCRGLFHGCAGGAQERRFNRLLIDAGFIKE